MPFDSLSALEIAKILFAGISAAAAAIGVWRRRRDKKDAAATFDETFAAERDSLRARRAAEELVELIPRDVIDLLESRADLCWTGYRAVLEGNYLPDEIDRATDAVRGCVCHELRRIRTLTGKIPNRWRDQWERFKCHSDRRMPRVSAPRKPAL